jgi:hypothetical protein
MPTQQKWIFTLLLAFSVGGALPGYAQESNAPNERPSPGWHRFGESTPDVKQQIDPVSGRVDELMEVSKGNENAIKDLGSRPQTEIQIDAPPSSSTLTLPAGTWITVRADQTLSSDHNEPGDAFTATLSQPLIANGRVIARRGQTVGGVVATAEKAGRVKGTSRLGLELTELSLVDGRQLQIRTTLMQSGGGTSVGRDIGAVGTTTAVGAAIGGVADGGFGAGMGAIAGAAASAIGILVTRGRPTVVYPEDLLTFRIEAPLTVSVESREDAFQPVRQDDYEQRTLSRPPPTPAPPPYPYYGGYYPYPRYFYGPSFYFYSSPRYFYRGGYYHGGYSHRRW